MKCAKCRFDNAEGVAFCVECGSKLEMICPNCGFGNLPSHKFCGGCGQALNARRRAENHEDRGVPIPAFRRLLKEKMDLLSVDVSDPAADVGDEVEIIGAHVGVDEVARHAQTIAYEVLTGLGRRLPRQFIETPLSG